MINARLPSPSSGDAAIAPARRRYLSPTDRRHRLEALMAAVGGGLDECLAAARHDILRGLHFRERDGFAIVEVLVPEPETVMLALRAAGFDCETKGMIVRASRRIRPRGGHRG